MYYKDCEVCSFTIEPTMHTVTGTTCDGCINGFIYVDQSGKRHCYSSCPYNPVTLNGVAGSKGMYGYREFQDRGRLKKSECRCKLYIN